MSTDRQRVKRAIQRIAVQAPELRSLLSDAESKGGKPKSSGVGGGAGSGGGDAQEKRVCCDGSVSEDGNPGVEERDPDSGGQDGGLNGDDPARLDSGEGVLSGVTDCATGEPICFDGAGFIPPDGWDGPSSPPIDQDLVDGYEEGIYWAIFVNNEPVCESLSAEQALSCYASVIGADSCRKSSTDNSIVCDFVNYINRILNDQSCGSITESYCNPTEEDFLVDEWPEDGCTNLAIVGGKIVGSKYDPENDGSYSAPRDSIALCDGDGNEIELSPAANGGWKTINSTNDSGYLYDSSGKVIAHIDGNEYSDPAI